MKKGLTQTEVAEKTGISQPYYNLIENDKNQKPLSFYVVEKLARVLGCDVKPLLKAVELSQLEYKREAVRQFEKRLGELSLPHLPKIPIVKEIPAEVPKKADDLSVKIIEGFFRIKLGDPAVFILKVSDKSMAPEIKRGDLVLICPSKIEKVKNGDIVAIRNNKGDCQLRRVTLYRDQFILTAENSAHPVLVWEAEEYELKIIGRVKGTMRYL